MIDDADLTARVTALSLECKVRLLTGADFWSLHAEPAVGLRRLVLSDGPAGVRGELWDERHTSANVPSPTALAATWDEELVEELGGLLASEARAKGVDVLLAPTINLHRTPFGGRHFECFSEDPLLTARIGVALVRGVQGGGVGATAKHFVANDSETQRTTLDARVDERTLRELYLAPFEALVRDAGVWAVMAAYNGVNGEPMTESALLASVLDGEWGFDGLVMSDWSAVGSTVASARAALHLVMPGPDGPWGEALLAAVRDGRVAESAIDAKVLRILRLAARAGALEGCATAAAAPTFDAPRVARTLRRAAAAGFVLVSNAGALPLDPTALGRVAVLGPHAAAPRTLGGGSATVYPPYAVSPLHGLRSGLGGGVAVDHAIGVNASERIPVAGPPHVHGVEVRFLDIGGALLGREERPGCAFTWMDAFGGDLAAEEVARVEVRATLRAVDPGTYLVACSGVGRHALSVGGELLLDGELALAPGADVVESIMAPPQSVHAIELDGGEQVEVVLARDVAGATPPVALQLNVRPPYAGDDAELERAVARARAADVAVVVVGTSEEVESEGFDRTTLALPGRQDELVERVAAANPRTVVVVNAGAPVLMPWAERVAAILLAWFPGQEFGNALADVLLGRAEPGGRLPTTWPASEDGLPSARPVAGVLAYDEGLHVGHRAGRRGLFAFGHGLGYTTWAYVSIEAARAGADVAVAVRVRNTGARAGREVVQVYASRPDGAVARPVRWLAGFAAVDAQPGEEVVATVTVRARAFEHWDAGWRVEPGTFVLAAGGSSSALAVSVEVTVGAAP